MAFVALEQPPCSEVSATQGQKTKLVESATTRAADTEKRGQDRIIVESHAADCVYSRSLSPVTLTYRT